MSDDETGYKKPPKKNQFKKGRSGNPKGRPKATRFKDYLIAEFSRRVTFTENGKVKDIPMSHALVKMLLKNAMEDKRKGGYHLIELLRKIDALDALDPPKREHKNTDQNFSALNFEEKEMLLELLRKINPD